MSYGGQTIDLDIAPLDGLISLNGANVPLLAALLQTGGGLDTGRAQALAAEIVAWRDTRPEVDPTSPGAASVQARRFEAPEDLLLVPGIDYTLYARIAPLVTAELSGGGQVNPLAAPPGVLAVLAHGDAARVATYLRQREEAPKSVLCTLTVEDHTDRDDVARYMLGGEPIVTPDGEALVDGHGHRAYVTSAGSGPSVGKHLLMAYLPPELVQECAAFLRIVLQLNEQRIHGCITRISLSLLLPYMCA